MSKVADFVLKIYEKTKSGDITWEKTQHDHVYQTSFPKYSIQICSGHDFENNPYVSLILYNDEGKMIETIHHDDQSLRVIDYSYECMKETFEIARRQAMGLEKALDDIIVYLERKDAPF